MAVLDPLTNLFTNYGFAATESAAADDHVTDATQATNAHAVIGAAPAAGSEVVVQVEEPGPDNFADLGDDLKLRIFSDPLFSGSVGPEQPVQGFLDNCPLIAVLTAMTHVPQMRSVIEAGGIIRERIGKFSTFRVRQSFEYPVGDEPSKMPRVPSDNSNFEGNRFFAANFFQGSREQSIGPKEAVHIRFGGHTVTRLISPVFYKFDGNNQFQGASLPLRLFYAHSTSPVLYPAALEKAYVYLKSGSGPVTYQIINNGLPIDEVMFEVAGYARHGLISQLPGESFDLLPDHRWKSWLKQHDKRPTVLGSKANTADPDLVEANHAFPVIGYSEKAKTITVVNVLKEVHQATDRVVTIPFAKIKPNFVNIVQGPTAYGEPPLSKEKKKVDID